MIRRQRIQSLFLTSVMSLVLAGSAAGQEWRGQGRISGKVVDEAGAPIEGAVIKATLPTSENRGPKEEKSNAKGEWAIGGISRGAWAVDVSKDGYETRSLSVPVQEGARMSPMVITLKKAAVAVDPNVEIRAEMTRAAGLVEAKQFAEARAIYERLAAQYPQIKQLRPLIARTYHGEGNTSKAIESLRAALAADPDNVEVKLLLANLLMDSGQAEESRAMLASIDDSKVTDPTIYLNIGIGLLNQRKQDEAITWFTRVVTRFPDHPDAYYYRGLAHLQLQKTTEAKADLQKFIAIAPPDAPELATAKKILDTIK